MCLFHSHFATEEFREAIKNGTALFCKMYAVTIDGKLVSPYQRINVVPDENGYIVSDRPSPEVTNHETAYGTISHGIHVYTGTPETRHIDKGWGETIVSVEVDVNDFVACDSMKSHAVFTKVKIDLQANQTRIAKAALEAGSPDEEDDDWQDDECCDECGEADCWGECLEDDDDWDDEADDWYADDDDEDEDWDDEESDEDF